MPQRPTILSIKWGTAFDAMDVNRLHRAARAQTTGDLRFICLTDDGTGLDDGIEVRDIPDIGLSEADIRRPGVWRKLSLYAPALHDLGRVLFVDLDMLIIGSLDGFFAPQEGVVMLNTGPSWRPAPRDPRTEPGTGIFSFDPAGEHQILAAFLADPQGHMARFHNEQDFVAAHASQVSLWPEGQVISFKRHLCRRLGLGLLRAPRAVPAGAAVVAFHGTPRPADTMTRPVWGPFPHVHAGRPPLVADYWARYS